MCLRSPAGCSPRPAQCRCRAPPAGRREVPQQSQTAVSVSNQHQRSGSATGTESSGSGSEQRPRSGTATDNRAAMSSRARIHGHSGLFRTEASSRWDRRCQGLKCIARGGRPLDTADPTDWHGRIGRDRAHHWRIAYASAKEVDVHLRVLCLSGAVPRGKAIGIMNIFDEIRAMTWRLLHP